jgi:hypothetical protein
MAKVKVHESIPKKFSNGWTLCFQKCTYHYDDESVEDGYRFIWKRPDGTLQAARGQARIPNASILHELTEAAKNAGWFS